MGPVLVTGGSGFVGANLVRRLAAGGADVHLFLRNEARTWRLEDVLPSVRVHRLDLRDEPAVREAVDAVRPAVVFHLAAYGAYSSQTDAARILRTNFDATVTLVEACARHGFRMFVHAGSSSEYGRKDHPMREEDMLDPNSAYAVAKAAATHYCRFAAVSRKLPIVTLRLFSVYGPWEEPSRFVPTLAFRLMDGGLPPLVSPETARDFIHVDDVVDVCEKVSSREDLAGEVLNVGTGRQSTIRDVVELALTLTGVKAEPRWGDMPGRPWDTSVWVSDSSKVQRTLNWEPRYDLRAGLEQSFDWFRRHRTVYEKVSAPA
jgi:nucleoside-diphosphate-sugar epimerase